MASGNTTTLALTDALPSARQAARIVREYGKVMTTKVERVTLREGEGLSWNEFSLSRLTAQSVTETTVMDNPQALAGTLFSVTPVVSGVQTIITERTLARVGKSVVSKFGALGQNAMERKKDIDLLAVLDTGTVISSLGAGTVLTQSALSATTSRSRYGAGVEPPTGTGYIILQSYQLKDIRDEIVAGIGTYTVPSGLTEEVFRKGFSGTFDSFNIFVDENITIDSSDDAKGGVFTSDTIVLVQGRSPWTYIRERPDIGGGANELFLYDEYAAGVRLTNSLFEIYSDALAPT